MSSSSQPEVKQGDKVRHNNGTEGVAMAGPNGGTVQVKTNKGVFEPWSVYDLSVIEEAKE